MNYKKQSIIFFFLSIMYIVLVLLGVFNKFDLLIYDWAISLSSPITDVFWRAFTILGDTEMLAILSAMIVSFLYFQKKFREMMLFLFIMSSGILLTLVLKLTIQIERPGEVEYIDFWGLGKDIISYSFPSGHAVKSLLLFGFLIWLLHYQYHKRKYTNLFIIIFKTIILLCSVGQIFLLAHYVSDIIGGFLVGLTCIYFFIFMYHSNGQSQSQKLETPVKQLGG